MSTYTRSIKRGAAAGMVAACLLSVLGTLSPAAAKSASAVAPIPAGDKAVKLTLIGTNAVGTDTLANRNAEYVVIKNTGAPVNVLDWKYRDGYGVRYTFTKAKLKDLAYTAAVVDNTATTTVDETAPATLMLPTGDTVVIYTGKGVDGTVDTKHTVYLNKSGHILNNTSGERIQIRNASGQTVAQVEYDAYGIRVTP